MATPPAVTIATEQHKKKCPQGSGGNGGENDEPTGVSIRTTTSAISTDYDLDNEVGCSCVCGRTFKTEKGMKIHRTKMGCLRPNPEQRSASQGEGKTSDPSGQVSNHSASEIQAMDDAIEVPITKERIKFPQASQTTVWKEVDQELCDKLVFRTGSSLDHKIRQFSEVVYEHCKGKFGVVVKKTPRSTPKSRRQTEIEALRRQKKEARKQWKLAGSEAKEGLKAIWVLLKKRHSDLCKGERALRRKKEQQRCRQEFFKGPFEFARKLFEQPRSGVLEVPRNELEQHLRSTYSDPLRLQDLSDMEGTTMATAPRTPFDCRPPSLKEIGQIVRKARNKSAPGPNGIPYLVYKKCPGVLKKLHGLLVNAWRQRHVSSEWNHADGVYIPKEKDARMIGQFRPISLLNVEGKIFFAVMATRLTRYLLHNGFVDTSIQKGGVPGVPGCIEHSAMIWEAVQRAKKNRMNLHVVWLDLANAYGAVPHSLLWRALTSYHVPEYMINILKAYFGGFRMRYRTKSYVTDWTQLEVGIAMGCTVSPILFVLAMQVLLKATEATAAPVKLGKGSIMPPLKAFMDDTTVMSNNASSMKEILARLDQLIMWSRMKFKPAKSRSLSLEKGKLDSHVVFRISGQAIPTVAEQPVKSLGRWYDKSLKDTKQGKDVQDVAKTGLQTIDKTKLQGKFKLWILQFMLIPKLLWPLQIYEIGLSTVEAMERMIRGYTRKWLGLPPGLTSLALYSRSTKLRLPLKSIAEEYKAAKVRLQMTLQNSTDPAVSNIMAKVKTGRKWQAAAVTAEAVEASKFKEILGATQTGRHGIGYNTEKRVWWSKATPKEKIDLVVQNVRQQEEAARYQKAVQQSQQGQWTAWEEALQRSLSWEEIWQMAPLRLSFLVRAMYDQLPSRENLVRWNKADDSQCPLCGEAQSMQHVLTACKVSLASGRYTWRHNQVLAKLVDAVTEACTNAKSRATSGDPGSRDNNTSILASASDWLVAADLPGKGTYPPAIRASGLRPDIVVSSQTLSTAILIELTVPFEANMAGSHEFKTAKYETLRQDLVRAGYQAQVFAIEIGVRGLVGASAYKLLVRLGLQKLQRTRCLKQLADAAEAASYWVWLKRDKEEWCTNSTDQQRQHK